MKKNDENLLVLNIVFAVSLVVSNVVAGKLFMTGASLFGFPVVLPPGLAYALTFLTTDIIGEIWGKEEAKKTVLYGFIGQVLASVLIYLSELLPPANEQVQNAYTLLLGQNWVFLAGAMIAYFCSQKWDVFIFHVIRERYLARHGNTSGRWIWNNVSTITSQMIDTFLFISISFGLGFGWLWDESKWGLLAAMICGQYIFKFILAIADTPFFYLLTRRSGEDG